MLIGKKFKTYEGARKCAAFESAIQPGEVKRGDRARAYKHRVVRDPREANIWRVERIAPTKEPTAKAIEEANHLAHQIGFRF